VTTALFLVDFRYTYDVYLPISMVPTNSGAFSNGTWSGSVTLLEMASNVTVRVRRSGEIAGISPPFDVVGAEQADVLSSLSTGTQPAPFITNFDYAIQISNAGPAAATSILLTHLIPSQLEFLSAAGGNCAYSNGVLICTMAALAPRSSASVGVRTRPLQAGAVMLGSTVSASQDDPNLANNLASLTVTICRDCDGDGIWDDWELAHNLNPCDPADGGLDPDHDGHTNLQEFQAGTDPNSSNSVTRISQVLISGNDVRIRFKGVTGKRYRLERSGGMSSNWTGIVTFKVGLSQTVELIDSSAMRRTNSFYRVRLLD
jgi:hypothetical protein